MAWSACAPHRPNRVLRVRWNGPIMPKCFGLFVRDLGRGRGRHPHREPVQLVDRERCRVRVDDIADDAQGLSGGVMAPYVLDAHLARLALRTADVEVGESKQDLRQSAGRTCRGGGRR